MVRRRFRKPVTSSFVAALSLGVIQPVLAVTGKAKAPVVTKAKPVHPKASVGKAAPYQIATPVPVDPEPVTLKVKLVTEDNEQSAKLKATTGVETIFEQDSTPPGKRRYRFGLTPYRVLGAKDAPVWFRVRVKIWEMVTPNQGRIVAQPEITVEEDKEQTVSQNAGTPDGYVLKVRPEL